jgi:phospholipase C
VQCEATYPTLRPPAPYGNQIAANVLFSLDGFKTVRGGLTEGRYPVFESNGYALTNPGTTDNQFTSTAAISDHSDIHSLFNDGESFNITSVVDSKHIPQHSSLATDVSGAEVCVIQYQGSGQGYSLQKENGKYLNLNSDGSISVDSTLAGYSIFSVTYSS